jgi:phosphoribosylanthranilate isomerase
MRTVKVKICGITREEDLKTAATLGADAVGFVVDVPSSSRSISAKKASELIQRVPIFMKSVVVIVPRAINEILKTCEEVSPNSIQIHGEHFDSDTSTLRKSLPHIHFIRAINTHSPNLIEVSLRASKTYDAVLIDSVVDGKYGGTGIVHDWKLSKQVKHAIQPKPLILAGGLNSENVGDAISVVQPYAVDVSTGVEVFPGRKDPKKMLSFIKNAKSVMMFDNQVEAGR